MNSVNNSANTYSISSPNIQNNPILSYTGTIDSLSISALLTQAENFLDSFNTPTDAKKKVLGIMIELLQNIFHHSPINISENKINAPSFTVKRNEKGFILIACNLIPESKISALKKHIEDINALSAEELKEQYQYILKSGKQKGESAGLGWIDIRRKSGNPIVFKFIRADNNYSVFSVRVSLLST